MSNKIFVIGGAGQAKVIISIPIKSKILIFSVILILKIKVIILELRNCLKIYILPNKNFENDEWLVDRIVNIPNRII